MSSFLYAEVDADGVGDVGRLGVGDAVEADGRGLDTAGDGDVRDADGLGERVGC